MHPANSVKNRLVLGASRHHGAALLRAEIRDGSIEHVDLVEEVDSWKAQKPPISTLQHKIATAQTGSGMSFGGKKTHCCCFFKVHFKRDAEGNHQLSRTASSKNYLIVHCSKTFSWKKEKERKRLVISFPKSLMHFLTTPNSTGKCGIKERFSA